MRGPIPGPSSLEAANEPSLAAPSITPEADYSPGGHNLVPHKRAGVFTRNRQKLPEKKIAKLQKEIAKNGKLSRKTRLISNPANMGLLSSLVGASGAVNRLVSAIQNLGKVGAPLVVPQAVQNAAGAMGFSIPPEVVLTAMGVGVVGSVGMALWKAGDNYRKCNAKIETTIQAGSDRVKAALENATETEWSQFRAGYRRASEVEGKRLSAKELEKLPEFNRLGYAAHNSSLLQEMPALIAAYRVGVEKALRGRGNDFHPGLYPEKVDKNKEKVPSPTIVPAVAASNKSATTSSPKGVIIHAHPESVRRVAEAVRAFQENLSELKHALLQSLASAREGWADEGGDRVEAEISDLLDSISVSEEVHAIERECIAFAVGLENL